MNWNKLIQLQNEYSAHTGQDISPQLYARLVTEEAQELHEALVAGFEETEILKEMADLCYVAAGVLTHTHKLAEAAGYDLEQAFVRVHENNWDRSTQDDGTVARREDGKILKNPNVKRVELGDLVKQ